MIFGRYFFLGLALTFAGTATSIVSYSIAHVVPIAALGIAAIIVGLTALSLPEQGTASDAMKALLRGSTVGIDPRLEEIKERRNSAKPSSEIPKPAPLNSLENAEDEVGSQEIVARAVYLPPKPNNKNSNKASSPDDERASVYIPLGNRTHATFDAMRLAPTILHPEDKAQEGIRVFTAGAYLAEVPEIRGEDTSIEDALQYILVESAELCSSVRASEVEETVIVEIDNVKVEPESESYRNLLGSLPTSLAASVVATLKEAPVVIADEEITPTKTVARLLIKQEKEGESEES